MPSLLRRETGLARGCCLHGWLAGTERRLETDLRLGPRGQDSSSPADRRCWELETVTEAPEASRMRCPNDKKEGGTSTNASERGDNVYHPSERCMFFFRGKLFISISAPSQIAFRGSWVASFVVVAAAAAQEIRSVRPSDGRSVGRTVGLARSYIFEHANAAAGRRRPFFFPRLLSSDPRVRRRRRRRRLQGLHPLPPPPPPPVAT